MLKNSAQQEFGLRFLLHLAQRPNEYVSLSRISAAEAVSLPYVRKIFGIMRDGSLVQASRGAQAGYRLLASPQEVSLRQVFLVLDTREVQAVFDCSHYSGKLNICVHNDACAIRPLINVIQSKLYDFLQGITLVDLLQEESSVREILSAEGGIHR